MKANSFPVKKVLYKTVFFLGILLLEQISLLLSMFIIYGADRLQSETMVNYLQSLPIMLFASLFLYDYLKLSNIQHKPVLSILYDDFKYASLFFVSICVCAYLLNLYALSRYALALGCFMFFILLTVWSLLLQKLRAKLYNKNSILVISESQEDAEKLIAKIRCEEAAMNQQVIGWAKPEDLLKNEEQFQGASSVLIASSVEEKSKFDILVLCSKLNKTVYIVPTFYDLSFSKYKIIKFYDMPTFQIENSGLTFQQRILKRLFDIVFSAFALILTSPLFLIISILIKLDSKGPVFYLQDRITYNGKVYKVFKFRTMIADAEKLYGAYQSVGQDKRVTRLGAFLRNSHLDELPQFANVILGSMSVVGPRSDRTITIDIMENQAVGYSYRLKAKSGITGLAQLFGKYNSDPGDKLRYDMYYIKNYSLLLDIQLIVLTVLSMLPKPQKEPILKAGSDYYIKLE